MVNRYVLSSLALAGLVQPACAYDVRARLDLEPLIVKHAAANGVPAALVHRIIIRESRYNPGAVGRGGAMGLMQIKHGTARALGYGGAPAGLLDADTNLTYGVRYLAGAYRVANGDQNRAVGFYARGYYYDAKRRGMLGTLAKGPVAGEPAAVAVVAPQPQQPSSVLSVMFPQRPAEPVQAAAQPVSVEPAAPAPPRRSSRSVTRRTVPSTPTVAGQLEANAIVAPTAVQAESQPPQRPRSLQQKAVAVPEPRPILIQGVGQPVVTGSGAEPPVRRSGRSARRSAASDGDRSGQKVSVQPGDPGRHP